MIANVWSGNFSATASSASATSTPGATTRSYFWRARNEKLGAYPSFGVGARTRPLTSSSRTARSIPRYAPWPKGSSIPAGKTSPIFARLAVTKQPHEETLPAQAGRSYPARVLDVAGDLCDGWSRTPTAATSHGWSVLRQQTTSRGYETGTSGRARPVTRGHARHTLTDRFAGQTCSRMTSRVRVYRL